MRRLSLLLIIVAGMLSPAVAQSTADTGPKEIQFRQIVNGTFTADGFNHINWMKDGRYYTTLERTRSDLELRKYDITTGEYEVIVGSSELEIEDREKPIIIQNYQFSSDESKLLIATDVEQIWRRSTRENYFVYDLESRELEQLTDSESKQRYAQLSPKGGKAAYVKNNNLFWVDLETGLETRITDDGEFNKIINGATDWVYEEEFGFAKAWYWSPDGQKIAFYRFDESHVKEFTMTDWEGQYPGTIRFKYPKAGEQNSRVRIGVYDLDSGETTWMDIGSEADQYIPRINWTQDSGTLAIRRMNRLQNRQDLMLADVETGETKTIKTETSEAWIDVNNDLTFLENGEQFIYVSEEDGYNHIYLYDMNGNLVRQVTKGNWEVTNFLGYDEQSGLIYYIGTEASPLQRHLYAIGIDGTGKRRLTDGESWNSVNMSPDYRYYIETTSSPMSPPVYTLHSGDGAEVRVLKDNVGLREKMNEYNFPTKEFFTIDLPQAELNAYMLKPYDFDPSEQYPVLVYGYGGPGSQTVTRQFGSGQRAIWHNFMTTKGYIVVSIDNRGTGARGRDFEKQVYKKLGQLEVTDQVDAARSLPEMFEFVDPNRIGIWGWSYGGYMASLLMEEGNDLYKMGIAVAPVTHWKFYDTIYTERFMQTPEMNPEGYEKGAPLNNAGKIKGSFLLVHGTGDDNVHFQNSVELVNALVEENVDFETLYYPNRSHSIYGGNTRRHLYRRLTDFILENL